MKRIIFISLILAFTAYGQQFTDPRDGKKYRTVKIGSLVWMAENLNYNAEGSKCYENSESYCKKYGRLYDWYAAMKACPSGWYLPSKEDWGDLIRTAGGEYVAGGKLKATIGWIYQGENGNGTDIYGFTALPGGFGNSNGNFKDAGRTGDWWSSSEYDGYSTANSQTMYFQAMYPFSDFTYWHHDYKISAYSVRCVKN